MTEYVDKLNVKGVDYNIKDNTSGYVTQSYHDNTKENISNKVSSINSDSTNTEYPSAKAVYDYIQSLDASEEEY